MVRPVSRLFGEIFPPAATEGFRLGMARYGLLLEYLEFAAVNRFMYLCPRPVGAPKGAKGPPPKIIFKTLLLLHPEMRRRVKLLGETFAKKLWREDVARWDNEWKPAIAKENLALQRVDVGSLSDEELIAHLERCLDATRRAATRHHSLNATAMLPLGDFLVHVREWTGLGPAEVLPLFRGASRVSRGATEELQALAKAIHERPEVLGGEDAKEIVNRLTSGDDAIGDAARRYLDTAGVRIATGYDFADLTLAEMPELIVESIRAAIAGLSTSNDDVAQREAALREKVPAQHRAAFDEMLSEARLTYRMRDERAYDNDSWSFGIARRVLLEAGRRLVAKKLLHDAEHVVELTSGEIASMLRGDPVRSADAAAADAQFRITHTFEDAPPFLGGTPSGPPPVEWFPPAAARAERAVRTVMHEMFSAREVAKKESQVSGFAASPGEVIGIARLVLDARDMARVRKGDVLITRATSPAYNALLPLIGGVVTDRGGTLSHAAVVAREYGIPAVVGCGNATERIQDGARVRVDGGRGTIEVV